MKLLLAILALTSFGIFVPRMHADDLTIDLTSIGRGTVDLGPVAAGTGAVTYDVAGLQILDPNVIAGVVNLNFTAAFVNAGDPLPAGAVMPAGALDALVVTESCVGVKVTIGGASDPCPGLSFLYTNDQVGNIVGVTGALNIGADVNAQVGGLLAADAAIGGGTETIGFGNPPAATPEPGTLSLMGTGLLGLAGVLRRKLRV